LHSNTWCLLKLCSLEYQFINYLANISRRFEPNVCWQIAHLCELWVRMWHLQENLNLVFLKWNRLVSLLRLSKSNFRTSLRLNFLPHTSHWKMAGSCLLAWRLISDTLRIISTLGHRSCWIFCHILYIDGWLARVYGHGAWDDYVFLMSNCRLSRRLKLLWHLSQVKLESGINSDDSLASIFHALNDSRSHVCALWELPLLLIWQVFSFIDWGSFQQRVHSYLVITWELPDTPTVHLMVKHTQQETLRA